jgi:hypothetical protein
MQQGGSHRSGEAVLVLGPANSGATYSTQQAPLQAVHDLTAGHSRMNSFQTISQLPASTSTPRAGALRSTRPR